MAWHPAEAPTRSVLKEHNTYNGASATFGTRPTINNSNAAVPTVAVANGACKQQPENVARGGEWKSAAE